MRAAVSRLGSAALATVAASIMVAVGPLTAPAIGAPTTPGVHLDVTTPRDGYRPGEAVPLRFTVTNSGTGACAVSTVADGSVRVLSASRDATALIPSFSRTRVVDGSAAAITPHIATLAPGRSVSFVSNTTGTQGLTVFTPLRDHSALTAFWPIGAHGTYRFQLAYQAAPLAGAGVCAGQSNVVTVAFAVGDAAGSTTWILIAIGLVLIVLFLAVVGLVIVLVSGRRSGRTISAAAAIVLLAGVLGGGFTRAVPARADVSFNGGSDSALTSQYVGCVGKITASDPSIYGTLDGKGSPTVKIYKWIYSSQDPLPGGTSRDSYIRWDSDDRGHIPGEAAGVTYDPCAELYHELYHAKDAAGGKLSDAKCGSTGLLTDEVRATLAENAYRARNGLPARTTYDGVKLPAKLSDCDPPRTPPGGKPPVKPAPGSTPPAKTGRHCANSCGGSNGDPHLTTFDGNRYEFQAVGEFDAVSASTGDLTIQVRQSPYPQSTTVAVNTAVAMAVGGTRLGFYLAGGAIAVHRDGAVVTLAAGDTALPGGATVGRTTDPYIGDVYDVTWSDGTVASLWRAGSYGLVFQVAPAPSRAGTFTGLLGNFDGDFHNDVAPKGGAPIAPSFATLYPGFADSWRITAAASLFDYPIGQSTTTYTDRAFPARAEPTVHPNDPGSTSARDACAAAGVTDPVDLANCVLDVTVTGAVDFAVSTGDIETLAGGTGGGGATPGGTTATVNVSAPGAVAQTTFTGAKGQRVYVRVLATTLPDQCGALILHGPDGHVLALGCVRANGQIDGTLLPADGTYTVDVDPAGNSVGTATLAIVLSTDQVLPATIDGTPVTAAIGLPGAQSRVTFAGTAGQKIFVDASNSTIIDQCGVLQLEDATGTPLAAGCLTRGAGNIDVFVLPSTGQYAAVVDPALDAIGQVTIRIIGVHDQAVAATLGGAPVAATITQPGSTASVTFTGVAGARVRVAFTASTLPGQCGLITLLAPDRSELTTGCVQGGAGSIPATTLPASGTYTLVVDPAGAATGTLNVSVAAG